MCMCVNVNGWFAGLRVRVRMRVCDCECANCRQRVWLDVGGSVYGKLASSPALLPSVPLLRCLACSLMSCAAYTSDLPASVAALLAPVITAKDPPTL